MGRTACCRDVRHEPVRAGPVRARAARPRGAPAREKKETPTTRRRSARRWTSSGSWRVCWRWRKGNGLGGSGGAGNGVAGACLTCPRPDEIKDDAEIRPALRAASARDAPDAAEHRPREPRVESSVCARRCSSSRTGSRRLARRGPPRARSKRRRAVVCRLSTRIRRRTARRRLRTGTRRRRTARPGAAVRRAAVRPGPSDRRRRTRPGGSGSRRRRGRDFVAPEGARGRIASRAQNKAWATTGSPPRLNWRAGARRDRAAGRAWTPSPRARASPPRRATRSDYSYGSGSDSGSARGSDSDSYMTDDSRTGCAAGSGRPAVTVPRDGGAGPMDLKDSPARLVAALCEAASRRWTSRRAAPVARPAHGALVARPRRRGEDRWRASPARRAGDGGDKLVLEPRRARDPGRRVRRRRRLDSEEVVGGHIRLDSNGETPSGLQSAAAAATAHALRRAHAEAGGGPRGGAGVDRAGPPRARRRRRARRASAAASPAGTWRTPWAAPWWGPRNPRG